MCIDVGKCCLLFIMFYVAVMLVVSLGSHSQAHTHTPCSPSLSSVNGRNLIKRMCNGGAANELEAMITRNEGNLMKMKTTTTTKKERKTGKKIVA